MSLDLSGVVTAGRNSWYVFAAMAIASLQLGAQERQYRIDDLGTLGAESGGYSYAYGINASGQVTGETGTATLHVAFLCAPGGGMSNLPTLGGVTSLGAGIADDGDVVGYSSTYNGATHAFWYRPVIGSRDLGTLGGLISYGAAINQAGEIVGSSSLSGYSPFRAFRYNADTGLEDLGTLGGVASYAYAINNRGDVAGCADTSDGASHAFVLRGSRMQDLGTLGGSGSCATGISDAGVVVGYARTPDGNQHAFRFSNGTMLDLGSLNETTSSAAGVNCRGDIVGVVYTLEDQERPFLYSDGSMLDLSSMIDPTAGWQLRTASGINNAGQITGYGVHDGDFHAYVLTPATGPRPERSRSCPEPAVRESTN